LFSEVALIMNPQPLTPLVGGSPLVDHGQRRYAYLVLRDLGLLGVAETAYMKGQLRQNTASPLVNVASVSVSM
jgi:hypothetical protein